MPRSKPAAPAPPPIDVAARDQRFFSYRRILRPVDPQKLLREKTKFDFTKGRPPDPHGPAPLGRVIVMEADA